LRAAIGSGRRQAAPVFQALPQYQIPSNAKLWRSLPAQEASMVGTAAAACVERGEKIPPTRVGDSLARGVPD
jgi:hypothetical protein